jgi:hypothetical protein
MILEMEFEESTCEIPLDFGEVHEVSDGGYEKGYAEGEAVGYEKGNADGYETGYKDGGDGILSMATGLDSLFNHANFPSGTDIEIYCPNFIRYAESIASSSTGLRKLTLICDDTSGRVGFGQAFNGSSVEILDISQFKHTPDGVVNCFLNAKIVTVIGAFDLSLLSSTLNFFAGASHIVDVNFVPETIGVNLAITSESLSVDSAKSAILGLKNYSGTDKAYAYTFTLHANVWALLDAEGATAPGGVTWKTYVDNLGWNT